MSIKLSELYEIAVRKGIAEDKRAADDIEKLLGREREAFDKLDEADKEFFDTEKLTNPYSDTRICVGDPDTEIRGLVVGIDMEVGEVLLADVVRRGGYLALPPPHRWVSAAGAI